MAAGAAGAAGAGASRRGSRVSVPPDTHNTGGAVSDEMRLCLTGCFRVSPQSAAGVVNEGLGGAAQLGAEAASRAERRVLRERSAVVAANNSRRRSAAGDRQKRVEPGRACWRHARVYL